MSPLLFAEIDFKARDFVEVGFEHQDFLVKLLWIQQGFQIN